MAGTRETRPVSIDEEIDRVLLEVFRKTIILVALGLAGLFLVFFAGHMISLSGSARTIMAVSAAAGSAALLFLWWILEYRNGIRDYSLLGTCVTAVPLVYTLIYIAVTYNPYVSINITFLLIGAGLLFISQAWYAVLVSMGVVGWLGVSYRFLTNSEWMFFGFLVIAGALVGAFVQIFRLGTIRRIEKLRIEDEQRRHDLQVALSEAREARRAAEETTRALEEAVDVAQQSRERFQHLSEATFEAVMIHGGGEIMDANTAMQRMFGYSLRELQDMSPTDLVTMADQETIAAHLQRASGKRVEVEARRKDGRTFTAELRGRAVTYQGIDAMVTAMRDVSSRKKVEAALVEARRRAEESAGQKSSFLANISHEIRTPMNGVVGMTSLLLDTPLSEEQHEYAQIIRTSADALLTVINDVLDYSKLEAGQLELENRDFSVRSCLEDAIDLVSLQASQKGIELAYQVHPNVPERIKADAVRLRQIVANLLSNAVKFTNDGEVVVSVSADRMQNGSFSLQFSVRDTGIGIPEARMHRLFRSFSQVDASTARKYGGTGLGLAICKRLAEAMGGTIWAESPPGDGSTFSFTITAPAGGPVVAEEQDAAAMLHGLSVAMFYRNAAAAACLRARLEALCVRVRWFPDIDIETSETAQGAYDIVLFDQALAPEPGNELRQSLPETLHDVPVVLLSPIGSLHQHAAPDVHSILPKPVKQRPLIEMLQAAKQGRSSVSGPFEERPSLNTLLAVESDVDHTVMSYLLDRCGFTFEVVRSGSDVVRAVLSHKYDLVLADARILQTVRDDVEQIRDEASPLARPFLIALASDASEVELAAAATSLFDEYLLKPVSMDSLFEASARAGRNEAETNPFPEEAPVTPAVSFLEYAATDPAFFTALRRDFLDNTAAALDSLSEAIGTGTDDRLGESIAYLRSVIEIAQAPELGPALDRLEKACLSGATQAAQIEIRSMRRLVDETASADCA